MHALALLDASGRFFRKLLCTAAWGDSGEQPWPRALYPFSTFSPPIPASCFESWCIPHGRLELAIKLVTPVGLI